MNRQSITTLYTSSYVYDHTIGVINPALDPYELVNAMNERLAYSKFGMSLGEMNADMDCMIGASYHDKPKGITQQLEEC